MKQCVHRCDNIIIELNRTKNMETLVRNFSCEQKIYNEEWYTQVQYYNDIKESFFFMFQASKSCFVKYYYMAKFD